MLKCKWTIFWFFVAVAAMFVAAATVARGDDLPVVLPVDLAEVLTVDPMEAALFEAGVFTDYVWRHAPQFSSETLNAQASVAVSAAGVDVSLWAVAAMEDADGIEAGDVFEVDLTLSKDFETAAGPVTVGFVEYFFPHGGASNAREVFVGFTPKGVVLSPWVTVYADLERKGALYAEAGIERAFDLGHGLVLTAGADASFANRYSNALTSGEAANAAQGWGAFVSVVRAFKDFELSALVRYDETAHDGESRWWAGLTAARGF